MNLQNVENRRCGKSTAMLEDGVNEDANVSAGRDETHVVIGSGGGASAVQKFHEAIVPHKLLPFSHLQDSLRPGVRYQQMHSCSLPARLFHFCCGNRMFCQIETAAESPCSISATLCCTGARRNLY